MIFQLMALFLLAFGYSRSVANGGKEKSPYKGERLVIEHMGERVPVDKQWSWSSLAYVDSVSGQVGNYFHATNGFVATNLSKSVVMTLTAHTPETWPTMGLPQLPAKFMWAGNPDAPEAKPRLPKDVKWRYVVAPVFAKEDYCLKRFQVAGYYNKPSKCIKKNPIIAWAVSHPDSVCNGLNLLGC